MRVLLVDDHALVRNGIASLLKSHRVEVIGEASDGFEALEKAHALRPDIVLMDIKMPRRNGLETTRILKSEMPQTKIVMLTVSDDEDDLFEAIKAGADGYILKNIRSEEFLALLDGVLKGEAAISSLLATKIIHEFARQTTRAAMPAHSDGDLTEREIEVLRLVTTGARNKEIAVKLDITENTVKYHLRNIMEKLHLNSKTQAAAYAVSKGITPELQ